MWSFGALVSIMAGHRAKWSEICDSWTIVINIWGSCELVGFKVILEPSVHWPQNGLYLENG